MGNENNVNSNKKILKIVVPVLFCCILIGMWIVKSQEVWSEKYNTDFALHVTDEFDLDKLKAYGLPIILDFGSDSCIPCKEMAPVLEALNEELQGKAIIKFIDVWKYKSLGEGFPIVLIPTQIFIDSEGNPYKPIDPEANDMKLYTLRSTGEHVYTAHEGVMSRDQLLNVLKEMGVK